MSSVSLAHLRPLASQIGKHIGLLGSGTGASRKAGVVGIRQHRGLSSLTRKDAVLTRALFSGRGYHHRNFELNLKGDDLWTLLNTVTGGSPLTSNHNLRPCYGTQAISVRHKSSSTPLNTVILFVPQQEAWVIERMGRFHRILEPGLNFLVPILDKIKYVNSLKEIAIDIPKQSAITKDNVVLTLDGVLYLRIVNPYKASYGVEDPEFAITQLAQTTMRSELGKIALDTIFRERESLNIQIVDSINKASDAWGISCLRYEIRDIQLPAKVQEAMQMQVEAERKKRARVLESEGIREAEINVAEGKKRSRILASEAEKQEKINYAQGDAQAMLAKADARAKSIAVIGKTLSTEAGKNAGSLIVAEQYVRAFQHLAKSSNTIMLPSDASNVPSMVTQAMTIYKQLSKSNEPTIRQDDGTDLEEYYSDDDDRKIKNGLSGAEDSNSADRFGAFAAAAEDANQKKG